MSKKDIEKKKLGFEKFWKYAGKMPTFQNYRGSDLFQSNCEKSGLKSEKTGFFFLTE